MPLARIRRWLSPEARQKKREEKLKQTVAAEHRAVLGKSPLDKR